MVEDGQNDFVHVLPQAQVNLLLLFQSVDQLGDTQRKKSSPDQSSGFVRHSKTASISLQQTNLIPGSVVDLRCQTLSFSFDGKAGLVQTQAEDLSVQVVVLVPQFVVLLWKHNVNSCKAVLVFVRYVSIEYRLLLYVILHLLARYSLYFHLATDTTAFHSSFFRVCAKVLLSRKFSQQ